MIVVTDLRVVGAGSRWLPNTRLQASALSQARFAPPEPGRYAVSRSSGVNDMKMALLVITFPLFALLCIRNRDACPRLEVTVIHYQRAGYYHRQSDIHKFSGF